MNALSRYRGCLVGLAVGDAVGTTVEFKPPGTFDPVTDMVGGGPFDLVAGEWTDDTSMALCLAESLTTCGEFDARDRMQRYVRWWQEGHLSSNGRCFDIGSTVQAALRRFLDDDEPYAGSTDPQAAGNGSLMRLAPVPLFFAAEPRQAVAISGQSSRTTHGTETCIDACRYFGGLIVGAVRGESKEALLSAQYTPADRLWDEQPLCAEVAEVASGSFKRRKPPAIEGSGYVVKALEAALWAFSQSESYEAGCLLAVNLGDDADTMAAIYGQIAGAYYGLEGVPERWRTRIAHAQLIVDFADKLHRRWS